MENWSEWLNLAARWIHIFAAILWVGQTYFFTWLDGRLHAEERSAGAGAAQVWMVHSGGFYVVEKRALEALPPRLQWFRWEAAFTWLSGMFLLVLVYYLGGTLLDPDVSGISHGAGVALGLGVIVAGWAVYDAVWRSPLGRTDTLGVAVCYALLVGVAYALAQTLSGRAAYLHVGALLGTLMTANVWMRILPAQRKMLEQVRAGGPPDPALAREAKLRSKHNTYMVVPVVFLMISHHFPSTYGESYNWLILAAMVLVGWGAAHLLRRA
jgi:uncharacterized membrane protein